MTTIALAWALLAASGPLHGVPAGSSAVGPSVTSSYGLSRPSTDPSAARAGIETLLRDMAASVLAGDPQRYLRSVWKGEPNWAREQENWAADLARHVPRRFDLELKTGDVALSDGWAEAEIVMTWSMGAERPRSLDFPARFARTEAGWLYAGEVWDTLEGDRVRVLFPDGFEKAADTVAAELPEVRERVHEGFELQADDVVHRVQQVKLYASMEHLQQSIYLSYAEPLGGWNEPGEAIKLLASQVRRRGSARVLLAHEYGHVATFELGDKAPLMPWWVLEGVAELAAESVGGGKPDRLVALWARSGGLLEWPRLADFRGEARDHPEHVYKQGQHMLGYISERFGRAARNAWLARMAAGASLDDATSVVLGLTFDQLDRDWRASIDPD